MANVLNDQLLGQNVGRLRSNRWWVGFVLAPLILGSANFETNSPEGVVAIYLWALQQRDFGLAHTLLTDNMTGGKDAFAWAVEQNTIFKRADLVIQGFDIFRAKIDGETAFVPNILSSRDSFVNRLGADEHELYQLKYTGGRWRIDRQKILSRTQRADWFERRIDVSNYIDELGADDDVPWKELE